MRADAVEPGDVLIFSGTPYLVTAVEQYGGHVNLTYADTNDGRPYTYSVDHQMEGR